METKEKIWLVLDAKKVITGPFCKEEILELFDKKEIKQDFYLSNHDLTWFSIQEREYLLSLIPEIKDIYKKHKEEERRKKRDKAKSTADKEKKSKVPSEEATQQIIGAEEVRKSSADKAKEILNDILKTTNTLKTKIKPAFKKASFKKLKTQKTTEDAGESLITKNKKVIYSTIIVVIASILIILGIVFSLRKPNEIEQKNPTLSSPATYKESVKNIKESFILKDIQKVRRGIAAIESSPATIAPLAITMAHKELLFDINEAIEGFKGIDVEKIKDEKRLAEVYNIFSIYHLPLNKEEGLKWARQAVNSMTNEATYELNLAAALIENKKETEAKALLSKIISNGSKSIIMEEQAHFLMAALNETNPMDHYKKILEINPISGESMLLLALEYGKDPDKIKNERELLERFIHLLPVTLDTRIKNFRLTPHKPSYSKVRDKIREKIGVKRDSLLLAVEGIISVKLKDFLLAKKSFQESLKLDEGNIYAAIGIAYQNLEEGNTEEAYLSLIDESKKHKNIFAVKALVGISHLRERNFPLAGKFLSPLLKSHEHLSQPWAWMAQVNLALNNKEEAFQQLEKSIKINPYDPIAVRSLISTDRSDLLNAKAMDEIFPF